MIVVLALTTTQIFVGGLIAIAAQTGLCLWYIKRLNTDPVDERQPAGPTLADTDAVKSREGSSGGSYQTQVATPRARKIQPARLSTDPADPETGEPSKAVDGAIPADSLAMADQSATASTKAPIKLGGPLPKEQELPEPAMASALTTQAPPTASETPVPVGALILGDAKAKEAAPAAAAMPAAPEAKADLPATPVLPPIRSTELPPSKAEEPVPTMGRKFFGPLAPAGSLTASATPPPAEKILPPPDGKDQEAAGQPPLWSLVSSAAAPGGTPVPEKPVDASAAKAKIPLPLDQPPGLTILKTAETPVAPVAPKDEPIKLAGGADVPFALAGVKDDVKKTPPTSIPEPPARPGLILIPSAEAKPEPVAAKVADATPAEPVSKVEDKPVAAPDKAAEPVLPPSVSDATPAAKAEGEAKTVKGPRVFLPGRFFGGSKAKDKEPAAIEAKADKEPAEKTPGKPVGPVDPAAKTEPELPKITTPPPALVIPPVEEIAAAKEEKASATAPEPLVAEAGSTAPTAKAAEPVVREPARSETVPAKTDDNSSAEKPAAKTETVPAPQAAAPEAAKPAKPADKAPGSAALPAAGAPPPSLVKPVAKEPALPVAPVPVELPKAAVKFPLPAQAAPETVPVVPIIRTFLPPAPPAPAVLEPVPVALREGEPAAPPAPTPTPAATIKPQPVMPPTESTTNLPNNGRASAQLTLGFEITSLQLTPFFKLGSVQLKALSNVVSLHLIAAQQQDSPLAASIAFQIDRVDLDEAAHLKSILLKPLGESREATVPLPKLQVDNVAIAQGSEGAPISVAASGQTSTVVQLLGTFTIAAMDFTPAFEIGSLRLEPTSNTVLLRVAPSSRPTALDLPPSFELAQVQLGDGAQITGVRVTPSGAK